MTRLGCQFQSNIIFGPQNMKKFLKRPGIGDFVEHWGWSKLKVDSINTDEWIELRKSKWMNDLTFHSTIVSDISHIN